MGYQGGKARLGKKIAAVINASLNGRPYFEPFMGFGGVMRHIKADNRAGCDLNPDVMEMWRQASAGWRPEKKKISREDYLALSEAPSPSPDRGFYGHQKSFGGQFFEGYVDCHNGDDLQKVFDNLWRGMEDVTFISSAPYDAHDIHGCVVYCDPPYKGTRPYRHLPPFDHSKFWATMDEWASRGNTVFVSEATPPPAAGAWEVVWTLDSALTGGTRTGKRMGAFKKKRTERLFRHT